jgi:hypothetical protein
MYQVLILRRPGDWTPRRCDDVPPVLNEPFAVASECVDLLEAQARAVEHNRAPARQADSAWAVVADSTARSRRWAGPRLCTPLTYKLAAIVRPEPWEPNSPSDVPNCLAKAGSQASGVELTYRQALDTMWALNQQSMDHADTTWFVPVAIENEPVEETVRYDPAGSESVVQVRRLHVIHPPKGGRGDCSYCPARNLPCREVAG